MFDLLQRYRRDRLVLLSFIISGSLIKKVVLPPGAVSLEDIDIDQVSVDYVINCVKTGEALDLAEAIRHFHDSLDFPSASNMGSAEEFFLVTNLESSGSVPTRSPPSVPVPLSAPIFNNLSRAESFHSPHKEEELTVDDIDDFEDDDEEIDNVLLSRRHSKEFSALILGLASFSTGMTDDDLRESAYEILVACAGASGGLIVPYHDKKKESKRTRLIRKLARSKNDNVASDPQRAPGMVGLLEVLRAQLEISESMDIRTRQGLLSALVGKVGKRMDNFLVPLELLCSVSRTEFSDKKAYLRWQKRQLNMLEEGLVNHPVAGFVEFGSKVKELQILLRKFEESESLPPSSGEVLRAEFLRSLRDISTSLAERPARGDLAGEVCHWADGYPLNVKLYEKMLCSVFDVLDEGKFTEEAEEILEFLQLTWRILGITETIHNTCYAWVLFRQFAITGEETLLPVVIKHLRKIPLKEQMGPQERLHLKSLCCLHEWDGRSQKLTFLQSFLFPIQGWADKKLGDYHLHFSEGSSIMTEIATVAMITRRILIEEHEDVMELDEQEKIETYISSSIKNALARVTHSIEAKSDTTDEHVLTLLAEEIKKLLKKESSTFSPVLSRWHPQAAIISASLLHKLYGYKLEPFLDRAEHLTEDVVSVFPAAESLQQYVITVIGSSCGEADLDDYCKRKLSLYQVEATSGMLVLRWMNSQMKTVVAWIERFIEQEVWDPISPHQRHASSIVEVYRIIEETVDQFFALKVPMRIGEFESLCRGLDSAFQVYTDNVVQQIVDKEDLIPPVPILTRYKREIGIKAFVRKEAADLRLTNDRNSNKINRLTTQNLCVRLNTIYYAVTELNKLENSMQERWTMKRLENINTRRSMSDKSRNMPSDTNNAFDGCRKVMNAAIGSICEFAGTKIIFWDLREHFISNLYRPSVSESRLELLMESLDLVLNELCDVITEPLRDRIVTGLLQASIDVLVRVLLDGGPSRVFLAADSKMLLDDLEVLKEFFISGGDGLPRGTVENVVARVRPIINLISLETRVLIDDLRDVSQGGRSRFGADSKTLVRVLCHRSDSEASRFLKKQFKIDRKSVV